MVTQFYRSASMQGDLSHEQNICPSVCPLIKRVNCDKQEKLLPTILIPYKRHLHLVF